MITLLLVVVLAGHGFRAVEQAVLLYHFEDHRECCGDLVEWRRELWEFAVHTFAAAVLTAALVHGT